MELDRLVPNSIMSGGPEDLSLIELLWKQDVDLGVGKEVYDQSLREEMERQREREYYKQQEKLKAQVAAREKEEKSKQEVVSRWLNQNYSRDGETGEWVKRQNKPPSEESGSISETTNVDESDETLTLEAALDYIGTRVDAEEFQTGANDNAAVAETFADDFSSFNAPTEVQPMLAPPAQNMQQLFIENLLQSPQNMENEWNQVEEYLNLSLTYHPAADQLSLVDDGSNVAGAVAADQQEFDHLDLKQQQQLEFTTSSSSHVIMDADAMFTNGVDVPLIQDASLAAPCSDTDPMPELGPMTMTNASILPQPCAMNTSLDWGEAAGSNMSTIFDNLTALPEDSIDDIDLENMEDLFNTMTQASDLLNDVTREDVNELVISRADNDTAISLPTPSFTDELADAFDGLEGATGGADYSGSDDRYDGPYRKISRLSESSSSSDSGFGGKGAFSPSSSLASSSSSSSYSGSPVDSTLGYHHLNSTTNSNDTDHDPHGTKALAHQVAHNHTYNTLPGHVPREVKKYAPKQQSKKGPQCRDAKRANEMKIPFSIDEIVESPVETFNDLLTKHSLSEEQLTLIRDIRRRGKNKLAAQNCRKRKVGVIVHLSDEMTDLHKLRDRLMEERAQMERETRRMREKFGHLYTHIFQSLRDERGEPYDPNLYSLQQSSDGNVFLVPRNVTTTANGSKTDINGNESSGSGNERNDRIKKRRSDK